MDDASQSGSPESPDADDGTDLIKQFIQTYESLPQLWNSADPLYTNKYKRSEGYKQLHEVYRKIKPNAKEADVKKQINTLRSNYRRELNKIKASRRSGADSVYTPNSWKFYALSFLQDTESSAVLPEKNDQTQVSATSQQRVICEPLPACQTSRSSLTPKQRPSKKAKPVGPMEKQNQLLQLACQYLSADSPNTAQSEDDYLNIAKVWANKLKGLHPMQRRFAEKAVNDILFEADMGNLHRDSVSINCGNMEQQTGTASRPFTLSNRTHNAIPWSPSTTSDSSTYIVPEPNVILLESSATSDGSTYQDQLSPPSMDAAT